MRALDRQGVEFSVGVKQRKPIRELIEQIPESDWVTVTDYPAGGEAQIAETKLKGFRLIVRRTRLVGAQAELFPDWRHRAFVTNRALPTMIADVDHRDHTQIELVIRDLKDQALAHSVKVRRQDRRGHERAYVLRIGRAVLQPAPNRGKPSLPQRRSVSCGAANAHGDQPTSSGSVSRATASMSATMSADESSASTRPCGTTANNASVTLSSCAGPGRL
jgi:hypothetical protein